jgi:hypothetical protein
MNTRLAMIAAALLATHTGGAAAQNVVERGGKTVEVLGLRNWTLRMVEDSLAKYAPQDSLHTHGSGDATRPPRG